MTYLLMSLMGCDNSPPRGMRDPFEKLIDRNDSDDEDYNEIDSIDPERVSKIHLQRCLTTEERNTFTSRPSTFSNVDTDSFVTRSSSSQP